MWSSLEQSISWFEWYAVTWFNWLCAVDSLLFSAVFVWGSWLSATETKVWIFLQIPVLSRKLYSQVETRMNLSQINCTANGYIWKYRAASECSMLLSFPVGTWLRKEFVNIDISGNLYVSQHEITAVWNTSCWYFWTEDHHTSRGMTWYKYQRRITRLYKKQWTRLERLLLFRSWSFCQGNRELMKRTFNLSFDVHCF
jgi:hypothetical protein